VLSLLTGVTLVTCAVIAAPVDVNGWFSTSGRVDAAPVEDRPSVAKSAATTAKGMRAGAPPIAAALAKVTLADGRTILLRWNPCQVITYKVNVSALPADDEAAALSEIRAAVDTLAGATGMRYSYRGTTQEVPRTTSIDDQSAELIVAVTTPSGTDMEIGGETLGFGGYHYTKWQVTTKPTRRPAVNGATSSGKPATSGAPTVRSAGAAISRGWVLLDRSAMTSLKPGFGRGLHRGNVMLHELAHTVGLDHVADRTQLMYPTLLKTAPDGYSPDDLAGLNRVGRPSGCITIPDSTTHDLT
jgi:hypothetical protein